MNWGSPDADREVHVRTTNVGSQRVVLAPFIGATWVARGSAYRRRRRTVTAILSVVTVVAVALSVLFVGALARPRTLAAMMFATVYGLLAAAGMVIGRRWLARTPDRSRWADDGGSAVLGALLFLFTPVLAGFGIAVLPAFFGRDFPGEQRARELTALLDDPRSD